MVNVPKAFIHINIFIEFRILIQKNHWIELPIVLKSRCTVGRQWKLAAYFVFQISKTQTWVGGA
jgi:hypothetical protein